MKAALVLGVNGQDGSYLAEVLLSRGYRVTGVGLQPESRWVQGSEFRYVPLDLTDEVALTGLLDFTQPNEIYVMAAVHGAAGYSYEAGWRAALAVNVASVHTCLEHIRRRNASARLFYPSSLKAFGNNPPPTIDEETPRVSTCLYGITKNAATDLLHYYRRQHGVWAAIGYYFNHDSPRRPGDYFLPRLAAHLAAKVGRREIIPAIATFDFWCDWGCSREFMSLTADLLQLDVAQDVIFATGQPMYAATLASKYASALQVAFPDPATARASAPPPCADVSALMRAVGRIPERTAEDVLSWILRERYGIGVDLAASL